MRNLTVYLRALLILMISLISVIFYFCLPLSYMIWVLVELKGIKFCGYLISRLEKRLHFEGVLYFVIWWLQNISRVFNFVISVKIRNESLIEYQFLLSLINEIVIKYVKESLISLLQIETCDIPVSISYFDQILFHDGGRYHIETSPLICSAHQWTGFYMITGSVTKELTSQTRQGI